MERKFFIKSTLATAALSVIDPFSVFDLFEEERDIMLPFIGGMQKITLLKRKSRLIPALNAQTGYHTQYGYQQSYDYGSLAPYNQWYAYQQAVAYWNQQLVAWQQQQQYNYWLQQSHIYRMQYMLSQYQGNQQIGQPSIAPAVRGIYGFAKDSYNQPTLFGLNTQQAPVEVKHTVKGAAKIFDRVNKFYGGEEAERAVLPQTSEGLAQIVLPNNTMLAGKYYHTEKGTVAISNPDQKVLSQDGTEGQLGKYVTKDGLQYMVV